MRLYLILVCCTFLMSCTCVKKDELIKSVDIDWVPSESRLEVKEMLKELDFKNIEKSVKRTSEELHYMVFAYSDREFKKINSKVYSFDLQVKDDLGDALYSKEYIFLKQEDNEYKLIEKMPIEVDGVGKIVYQDEMFEFIEDKK